MEFFGLGREDRIKEATAWIPRSTQPTQKKLKDIQYVPREMCDKLMENSKPNRKFEEKAAEINEKAKEAVQNCSNLNANDCKEFLKGMYPDADFSKGLNSVCGKVLHDLSYTGADGNLQQYMGTLGRIPALTNMMYLYGMNKGYTFDEMLNSKTIDRAALS